VSAIAYAARGYLGVPWRHLGRSLAGVDCIGLVILAHRAAGHEVPDPAPYAREPIGARVIAGIEAAGGKRVPRPRAGDVLVFRVDGVNGGHLGIASDTSFGPCVIHAYAPRRRVVEELLSHDLAEALIGAWRIDGG
jgi:cell wall-associated NlpC family hydrolase